MYVARQAKIRGVQNFVCGRVVQDGLGTVTFNISDYPLKGAAKIKTICLLDTGLVGKGTEPGDRVVERGVDLYRLSDHILDLYFVSLMATGTCKCSKLTSLIMLSLYLLLT